MPKNRGVAQSAYHAAGGGVGAGSLPDGTVSPPVSSRGSGLAITRRVRWIRGMPFRPPTGRQVGSGNCRFLVVAKNLVATLVRFVAFAEGSSGRLQTSVSRSFAGSSNRDADWQAVFVYGGTPRLRNGLGQQRSIRLPLQAGSAIVEAFLVRDRRNAETSINGWTQQTIVAGPTWQLWWCCR